jgi:hypothetical protein
MEPGFYRCKPCGRCWSRLELKMGRNEPPVCPSCGSNEQLTDQTREEEYVKSVYGPVVKAIVET